jgi:hypothetical protein
VWWLLVAFLDWGDPLCTLLRDPGTNLCSELREPFDDLKYPFDDLKNPHPTIDPEDRIRTSELKTPKTLRPRLRLRLRQVK